MHTSFPTWDQAAPSLLSRYGIALLFVTQAAVFMFVLRHLGYSGVFLLFYWAVLASAWFGGLTSALVATACSALLSIYILYPTFGVSAAGAFNIVRLGLFVSFSYIISRLVSTHTGSLAILHDSEKHYRQLFNRNLAGVFLSTINGQILDCNESFAKILGYDSREEAMARPASDFYFDFEHRETYLERLKSEGSVTTYEVCLRSKDDTPVWIIENVSLIEDGGGARTLLQGTIIDVTERKRIEEALREAERKYRDVFDNVGEGIFKTTTSGECIAANMAQARMLGFATPEELIANRQHDAQQIYVDPRCGDDFKRLLDEHGLVRGFEHEIFRKDGSKIWISVSASAVRDKDGTILYYEGTARDISERKRAEKALRDSEERYRDLVESSREFICTHDLNGVILSANRAACDAFGYALRDNIGRLNFRDLLVPEVRDQFDDYLARIRRDGVASGLTLLQTSSGDRRVLEYYNTLRAEGVTTPIVWGMARDITEQRRAEKALRESEERYRELFENAQDAIYVHDLNGDYIAVNRAAEKLSGYSRSEIIGRNLAEFVPPKYVELIRERIRDKLAGQQHTAYEVEIITKDGRRLQVEVNSQLIYENGVAVGVQGMARDISDRKRAEEALRTFPQRLIETQEAERRRVARELHDEIGQTLTAIRINIQNLKQSTGIEPFVSHLDGSLSLVDVALQRVRDLALDLRPSLLDDLGLVAALHWYLEREAARADLALELNIDLIETRLVPEIETACFRITQEAMTNAVRHARATHISIVLQSRDSELRLLIRDDGVGFDVDTVHHRLAPGASLGLLGMQERALAVGGMIKIKSDKVNGTEIHVRLPFLPKLIAHDED